MPEPDPDFSVVVPAYNEAASIPTFHRRLAAAMKPLGSWEVVYVNDGSRDSTLERMCALRTEDGHVAVLNLSRNFGKEIAMTAGLEHARGQAVIVIDADLQDPPELIPQLVVAWRRGFDVVTARRVARDGESWLKRITAELFYRSMQSLGPVQLPRDTGDFRLMSRRVVVAVLALREQHRFMKGLFAWVGFPTTSVFYRRSARHAGHTTWSWWRLWNFAIEGITSFTVMPLKLATYLGLLTAVSAMVFAAQVIVRTLLFGNSVAGYPSLVTIVLFLGGIQLMTLGVMGEYLGRIFNETKKRPLYVLERMLPAESFAGPAERIALANRTPETVG